MTLNEAGSTLTDEHRDELRKLASLADVRIREDVPVPNSRTACIGCFA